VKCPNCQAENADGAALCVACGAVLDIPVPPTDEERARRLVEEAFRLADEGKLAQAISTCRRAAAANPNSTSAYSLLGILYERAGQRELAIQAYESALRLSPDSTADREALQQLVSSPVAPEAVTEVSRAPGPFPSGFAAAVSPPAPRPRRRPSRARRSAAIGWFVAALLGVVFVVLVAAVLQVSRSRPSQSQREPATTATAPPLVQAPAQPTAPPMTAGMQMPQVAPGSAPPVPVPTVQPPPEPAAVTSVTPEPNAPVEPPQPEVEITIPAPDAFILYAPAPEAPPATTTEAAPATPTVESARTFVFKGDVAEAIRTYEAVIADKPQVTPETYQEVGWLYYQTGRKADAAAAYRESLARYRAQVTASTDVDAARHGIRTAEAALRVLELE
jgi:tetratricopeptide (TPR) repeat protein